VSTSTQIKSSSLPEPNQHQESPQNLRPPLPWRQGGRRLLEGTRLLENELQAELQLSGLVGRTGNYAKTTGIVDVVPRRAQDRRVQQVK
jgi:hypothetical protein